MNEVSRDTREYLRMAYEETDLHKFLGFVLPEEWYGVLARIIESGAYFTDKPVPWAARWSPIPLTQKKAEDEGWAMMKSIIYRVHDSLHQLWGLPHPLTWSEEEAYYFKRVAMCGEVAVLTLTEFVYCDWLLEQCPDLKEWMWARNALPLLENELRGRSTQQIAARLDGILHKKVRPLWVRDSSIATNFADDYEPMLENDRAINDRNWQTMKEQRWVPLGAPTSRALADLDGLELTLWMISDFEHLLTTTPVIDWPLVEFNAARRRKLEFPKGWAA